MSPVALHHLINCHVIIIIILKQGTLHWQQVAKKSNKAPVDDLH